MMEDAGAGFLESIEQLRSICLVLPEATEQETWGEPTFRVRGKIFALFQSDEGRPAVWCKSQPELQEAMVGSDPNRFFVPRYLGHKGWVGTRLNGDVDWVDVAGLVDESYRMIAPKRLVAQLANG